ncbi:MAG: gluconate 2-dehydrogenase subunit 3 family protein [Phenylobacterium sp.]|nr:MAG: gluconate 2-dehydrogenase subunit 3 family protein [Phenylobacterium sp.]
MSEEPYVSKIDRRTALTWVGVVGAAVAVGAGVVVYGPKMGGEPSTRGYGTDPKLTKPEPAPWSRIMSHDQLQATAIMADFILPATAGAPSASGLGVPDFIDEWISAPYPDQLKHRPIILDGLNGLFWEAQRRHGLSFLDASPAQRSEVLTDLQTAAATAPQGFFKVFRGLTIGAYYTTAAGFKDIGYIGNVPRTADPGPSDEVKARLEREFAKLGL